MLPFPPQSLGGDVAGFAAAQLVGAHPLVGIVVSAVVLHEFQGAGWGKVLLVCAQAAAYAAAVALLAASAVV